MKKASPSAGRHPRRLRPGRHRHDLRGARRGRDQRADRRRVLPGQSCSTSRDVQAGGRRARCCGRTSSSTATSCSKPAAAGADAVLLIAECLPGDRASRAPARGGRARASHAGRTARRGPTAAGARLRRAGGRHQQPRPADVHDAARTHAGTAAEDSRWTAPW